MQLIDDLIPTNLQAFMSASKDMHLDELLLEEEKQSTKSLKALRIFYCDEVTLLFTGDVLPHEQNPGEDFVRRCCE